MDPAHVRFRADPAKIRVSIRAAAGGWIGTVALRSIVGATISAFSVDPEHAVGDALKEAEAECWDGIDLGMGRTYTHPHTRAA